MYTWQAADNPTCAEMRDVCASQGLKVDVEVQLIHWLRYTLSIIVS